MHEASRGSAFLATRTNPNSTLAVASNGLIEHSGPSFGSFGNLLKIRGLRRYLALAKTISEKRRDTYQAINGQFYNIRLKLSSGDQTEEVKMLPMT